MDLHDYIETLRQRWRFVAVCVLLGLAGAIAVTALTPRTYTATAQLFIATSDEDVGSAYQGGLFTQQRVKSYTRIVTSPTVLDGVISKLGLETTPGRLAEQIHAQAPLDTTLIDIRVDDRSAIRAQAIADETAVQFTQYIAAIETSSSNAPLLVKASVIGGSEPPSTPTSPRPTLNLAIGLFAGIVIGTGGAVLRHTLDPTLHTARDVGTRLGLTAIGVVPPPTRYRPGASPPLGTTRRTEALNQIRTHLWFTAGDNRPDSVLVASARPREGRTQTALDLSTSLARTGLRVVLVEADLRRPRLAEALGLSGTVGLTDVLTGQLPLNDALQHCPYERFHVLPSGSVPMDPSTLLSSSAMARVMQTLESDADLVVLDSPPLLPFADGVALASVAQGVLFVVRAGRTRVDDARRAVDTLSSTRARLLGTVLTGAHGEGLSDWRPQRSEPAQAPARDDRTPASRTVAPVSGRHHE